ncbi:MAG: aspartate aminotransferase family protein [Chloroflexota bacterium]
MTTTQEIIDLEQKYILQTYKRPEFVLDRGEGVWLYDSEGKSYLDAGSGIAVTALGHHNQVIADTIRAAADGLIHVSNLYHTAPHALLARDLCESSFADRVFFCNSGAEANEGALKFARKWAYKKGYSDKTNLVSFTGSFHGRTMGALSATATKKYRTPFEPLIGDVSFAEYNNLDHAREVITERTCGVILEPVQGEGGVTPADPEFLAGLRAHCDEVGALLIADEVQCGLGRTGTLWAYEGYDIKPDLMTLAKPLGGGLPIGAILLSQAVADEIEPGDHGSTFAAGPLVCSVAHATFQQINQAQFLADVQARGSYMAEKINELIGKTPLISGSRGKGLIWGLISEIPAGEIVAEARNHGLIILVAGEKIVRLLPPLTITNEEIDSLMERLLATLEAVG